MTHVESRQGDGRRQQQIIALEEAGKRNMQFRALELRADIVSGGCLEPLRRGSDKGWLGLLANPPARGLQGRRERGAPQRVPGRGRVAATRRVGSITVRSVVSAH